MLVRSSSSTRRGATIAAALALLGSWIGAEAGHGHAHLGATADQHPPTHHVTGGHSAAQTAGLDLPDSGPDHLHADLTATASSSGPHQLELESAQVSTQRGLPVTARLLRAGSPGEPPSPRARASPHPPQSRAPPVS